MDVTTFFSRLLQPPKQDKGVKQPDDINDFDSAWTSIKVSSVVFSLLVAKHRLRCNTLMRGN